MNIRGVWTGWVLLALLPAKVGAVSPHSGEFPELDPCLIKVKSLFYSPETAPLNTNTIRNFLLGAAIGDAMGVGVEIQSAEWIQANVDLESYPNARTGKHAIGYVPGGYSDDAADTLAVVKTLMDPEGFTEESLFRNMQAEWEASKTSRGGVPRVGYGSAGDVFQGKKTLEKVKADQMSRQYPGNAPPMRAAPLGLLRSAAEVERLAIVNADVTHPHPKARAASAGIAWAARAIIRNRLDPDLLIAEVAQRVRPLDVETADYLIQVAALRPTVGEGLRDFLSPEDRVTLLGPQPIPHFTHAEIFGLPVDAMRTLGAVLFILKHASSPLVGLRMALDLGGDVDTVAATTLGILGARDGLEELPPFMLEQLENRAEIEALAERFSAWLIERP